MVTVIRWTARILSILFLAFHLMSFIGDQPTAALSRMDHINLALWGLIMLGMIIAWKWDGIAGLFIVAVSAVQYIIDPMLPSLWAFWIAPLTGILSVICRMMSRKKGDSIPKAA